MNRLTHATNPVSSVFLLPHTWVVTEYIEIFYNKKRWHSGIGYRTPAQAHAEMLIEAAA